MRLFAFEGIRYTPAAGDVAELAALPYDQIDDALRIRYHVKSPQQIVQLTRPVAAPGGNEYQSAAALHRQWLEEGLVVRDERPALYLYVIRLQDGGERLGVTGLIALDAAPAALASPPADRLALLEAMRVDLEPVFVLVEDGGRLDELIREDVRRLAPLVHHEDPDENLHVIYKLDDPARIALYQQAVAGAAASTLAGGHAVYQAAQSFAGSHGAQPGTAAAAKLAVVSGGGADGGGVQVMSGLVWADHDSKVL